MKKWLFKDKYLQQRWKKSNKLDSFEIKKDLFFFHLSEEMSGLFPWKSLLAWIIMEEKSHTVGITFCLVYEEWDYDSQNHHLMWLSLSFGLDLESTVHTQFLIQLVDLFMYWFIDF